MNKNGTIEFKMRQTFLEPRGWWWNIECHWESNLGPRKTQSLCHDLEQCYGWMLKTESDIEAGTLVGEAA